MSGGLPPIEKDGEQYLTLRPWAWCVYAPGPGVDSPLKTPRTLALGVPIEYAGARTLDWPVAPGR
jgi:hypothetical protein